MKKNGGFTLIELVISMILISILVGVVSMLIAAPMRSYNDSAERAQLIQMAEVALMRLSRDIQSAVPNSIRVTADGNTLELLPTVLSARYRADGANALTFTGPQSSFNLLLDYATLSSALTNYTTMRIPTTGQVSNVLNSGLYPGFLSLIIYNTGQYAYQNGTVNFDYDQPLPGINLYNPNAYDGSLGTYPPVGSHVITPSTVYFTFTDMSNLNPAETTITLSDAQGNPVTFQFALPSPKNIVYLAESPVSYTCDGWNLWRYTDYPLQSTQLNYTGLSNLVSTPPPMAVQDLKLTQGVTACSFHYEHLAGQGAGLLSVTLTLAQTRADNSLPSGGSESIAQSAAAQDVKMTIFRQIQVKNVL